MKGKILLQKTAMLLFAAGYNSAVYWGSRLIAQNNPHFFLGFSFEDKIPLLPWTIYIYWGCYLFWGINYILSVRGEMRRAYRFILAELIAKTICLLFYILLPTTMHRPEITGNSLSETLLRDLYLSDAPDNLLPSIHCLASWLCYIGIRGQKTIPKWYQAFSCLFALTVCLSTLTVKQHVLIDVFAGIALAEFGYWLAGKQRFYYRLQQQEFPNRDTFRKR